MQKPNYTFKLYIMALLFLSFSFGRINAMPIGTISADDVSICEESTINLTFTATVGIGNYDIVVNGTTYSGISSGAVFSTLTEGIDFTGNTTFNLEAIYDLGAVDTNATPMNAVMITVNPAANVGVVMGAPDVCIGSSITLTGSALGGSGPYTYNWNISNGNLSGSSTTSTINVSGITAGSAVVNYTVTDANGCISLLSPPKMIAINNLPTAGTITGSSLVCNGSSVVLGSNPSGGTTPYSSYNWSVGTGNLIGSSMVDSIIVTGAIVGLENVSYTVTDANGCVSPPSSSKLMSISSIPVANPITGVDSICLGGSTTLTANPSGGPTPYTIDWTSTNMNTTGTSMIETIILTGAAAGSTNWTYKATDTNGCASLPSSIFTTVVNPLPVAGSIIGNNMVCVGATTTLTGNPLGGTAPYTYSWNLSNGNISGSSTTNTIVLTGAIPNTTDVVFSLVDAKGCTSSGLSNPITVTVNPLPIVGSATGATAICENVTTTITANPSGGTPFYQYDWILNGNISGSSTSNTINLTGGAAGNGTVRYVVTDSNGCISADTSAAHGITIQPLPFAGNITGTSQVCIGDSITLSTSASNGTMPYSYVWTFGGNLGGNSVTENIVLEGITAGMANVTQITTDANGCVSSVSPIFVATINSLPTPSITSIENSGLMSNDAIICAGDSITLDAGNYVSYNWDDMNNTTSQLLTITPVMDMTSTVAVTDANGCVSTANITTIVNIIPSIDSINIPTNSKSGEDFQIELFANVMSPTYTWNAIESNVTGATTGQSTNDQIIENLLLLTNRTGGFVDYSVGIEAEGCIGSLFDFSIDILNLGMDEILSIPNTFSPNGDGLNETWNISLLDGNGNPDNYSVMIFNRSGAIVYEAPISSGGWSGDKAPDGGYLYIIKGPNSSILKGTITLIR